MNNNENAKEFILSNLWKLYPLNISNIPIKKLLIILGLANDFKIKIPIIKKNINLIFVFFKKIDEKNTTEVRIVKGILKIKRELVGLI